MARDSHLEQRQARHRHSRYLYPWNYRYVKGFQSKFCPYLELSIAVAAGCAVAYGTKRGVFSINYSNTSVGKLSFIVAGPTLGSNMLGTSFIAWKAWYARLTPDNISDHIVDVGNVANK